MQCTCTVANISKTIPSIICKIQAYTYVCSFILSRSDLLCIQNKNTHTISLERPDSKCDFKHVNVKPGMFEFVPITGYKTAEP